MDDAPPKAALPALTTPFCWTACMVPRLSQEKNRHTHRGNGLKYLSLQ
jgi:hypothetical protein